MTKAESETQRIEELEAIRSQIGDTVIDQAIQKGTTASALALEHMRNHQTAMKLADEAANYMNESPDRQPPQSHGNST